VTVVPGRKRKYGRVFWAGIAVFVASAVILAVGQGPNADGPSKHPAVYVIGSILLGI
jgi:hypothetical protein